MSNNNCQFVRVGDLPNEEPKSVTYWSEGAVEKTDYEIYRIKTVTGKIKHSDKFDRDVNFYIKLGYELVDRYADGKFLVAELVKFKSPD